jgi:hypothetical protein
MFNDKHLFDDGRFDPDMFPHTHAIFVCSSFVENKVGHERKPLQFCWELG